MKSIKNKKRKRTPTSPKNVCKILLFSWAKKEGVFRLKKTHPYKTLKEVQIRGPFGAYKSKKGPKMVKSAAFSYDPYK
jgi:hypothetical protein